MFFKIFVFKVYKSAVLNNNSLKMVDITFINKF